MSDPAKPVSKVDQQFMHRVEKYQEKHFQKIGTFDPVLFQELLEMVNEVDELGEIELFVMSKNKMHDDTTSGLVCVICNGECYALAGLTDK
jgi:hypothetical protein